MTQSPDAPFAQGYRPRLTGAYPTSPSLRSNSSPRSELRICPNRYTLKLKMVINFPQRVGIDTGSVIDAQGRESKQIDIVIYDKTVATVFDINGIKYFSCEIFIAVGEVKSNIDSKEDEDALDEIKSVN